MSENQKRPHDNCFVKHFLGRLSPTRQAPVYLCLFSLVSVYFEALRLLYCLILCYLKRLSLRCLYLSVSHSLSLEFSRGVVAHIHSFSCKENASYHTSFFAVSVLSLWVSVMCFISSLLPRPLSPKCDSSEMTDCSVAEIKSETHDPKLNKVSGWVGGFKYRDTIFGLQQNDNISQITGVYVG